MWCTSRWTQIGTEIVCHPLASLRQKGAGETKQGGRWRRQKGQIEEEVNKLSQSAQETDSNMKVVQRHTALDQIKIEEDMHTNIQHKNHLPPSCVNEASLILTKLPNLKRNRPIVFSHLSCWHQRLFPALSQYETIGFIQLEGNPRVGTQHTLKIWLLVLLLDKQVQKKILT